MVEILNDTKASILSEKDCEKIIQICVPKDRVIVEIENMYNNLQLVAEVPGFRAGKAPRPVIQKYYREKVEKDVLDKLVSDGYVNALKTLNLNPINYPSISELKFSVGEPLEFKAAIEIKPEVKLGKYKGIKVKKEVVELKPEEVEKSLNYIREKQAQFIPAEDRPAKSGDFALVDFTGTVDGVEDAKLKANDYVIELGTNKVLPELDAGILKMKPGSIKDIAVDYKPDFVNKALAGKKVIYKVTLKSIREKKLPELNDEFAKDVGDFKSLEDLKKNIEEGMKKELENKEKVRVTNIIVDELVKEASFPVPKSLVEHEKESLVSDFESRMKQQNVTYEILGKKKEDLEKEYTEAAVKRVKGYLLLEKVSEAEKLEVSEEEIDKEIQVFLGRAGQEADSWKEFLSSEKGRNNVRGQLQQDKVLDFLVKNAEIN